MQLLEIWPTLNLKEQKSLLDQISKLDLNTLAQAKALLHQTKPPLSFTPFTRFSFSGNQENFQAGLKWMQEGKVGCLLLAGGQGTRLRWEGPKGTYPISLIKGKSLFQLFAEKAVAAGDLPIAIMTSEENDAATQAFFQNNQFFGLNPRRVSFFSQSTLPLLDGQGHLFLETRSRLAAGPSGNGNSLQDFYHSGIAKQWQSEGIELVNVVLVDNPLAVPFDAELFGFHAKHGYEATLKCIERKDPEEKVGVIVEGEGKVKVIEYSELPDEEKQAQIGGQLKHRLANLSLFCFSLNFIEKVACSTDPLPLHKAWKAAKYLDEQGKTQLSDKPIAWKFETFIFDVLPLAEKVGALVYPREEVFAPLKNAEGQDSPKTVQQAIMKREGKILETITGLPAPHGTIELAADFYYPSQKLINAWKNRTSQGYLESEPLNKGF